MNDASKYTTIAGFALLLTVILFTSLSYLKSVDHVLRNEKENDAYHSQVMKEYNTVALLDDTYVNKSDILYYIKLHTREIPFIIQNRLTSNDVMYGAYCDSGDICLELNTPLENWEISRLETYINSLVYGAGYDMTNSQFKSKITYNEDRTIKYISFTLEEKP